MIDGVLNNYETQDRVANCYFGISPELVDNLKELYDRCSKDIGNFGDKKSIAITHCNECDWDNEKLIELFKDWNIYYSDGETHNDIW